MSKCFAERCSSILLLPPSSRRCARPAALPTRQCQHQQQRRRQRAMVTVMRRCGFSTASASRKDSRIRDIGRDISDDYAVIRDHYQTPRHPIVLAHGLLGFSKLTLNPSLPAIHYWHGIQEALTAQGASVVTATVPPSSSIADRAARLSAEIAAQVPPASSSSDSSGAPGVNIVAHSMGGLDARHMIRHCPPPGVKIHSLVTVATPHRGSAFADYLLDGDGSGPPVPLPRLYGVMGRLGLGTEAFAQLTRAHMVRDFNPSTPDDPAVRYFSYGARVDGPLPLLSPFRLPRRIVGAAEGPNDGLVSVGSSRWGEYKGTLVGVSHLDLINWSNRLRWTVRGWMGMKKRFNAVAFYLDIADMLAKEGL